MLRQHGTATRYTEPYFLLLCLVMLFPFLMLFSNVNSELIIDPDGTFCKFYYIVTRNNIVWKLAYGYCLCCCKTFLLVPDSTECTKIFVTEKCSTLFVSPKIK